MTTRLAQRAQRAVRRLAQISPASATLRRRAMGGYDPATGRTAAPVVSEIPVVGARFSYGRHTGADGLAAARAVALLPAVTLVNGVEQPVEPRENDELVDLAGTVWAIRKVHPRSMGGAVIGTRCELGAGA